MLIFMEGVLGILRFALGASVFSFLNVVIYRLPLGEGVTKGRSHCPGCGKVLTARELIPCISYLVQGRKCRGCGMRISPRYFWMEMAGGIGMICCGLHFGYGAWGLISWRGLLAFAYLGILLTVALIDWDTQTIWDRFHVCIGLLGLAALWLFPEHGLGDRLCGMVIVAAPMLGLSLLVEGAFGGGDIKLMAVSGFLLGWRAILLAMFLSLVAGGVYCGWMLWWGKLGRKDVLAFGPFLAIGLAIAFFYGDIIAGWYLSLL